MKFRLGKKNVKHCTQIQEALNLIFIIYIGGISKNFVFLIHRGVRYKEPNMSKKLGRHPY